MAQFRSWKPAIAGPSGFQANTLATLETQRWICPEFLGSWLALDQEVRFPTHDYLHVHHVLYHAREPPRLEQGRGVTSRARRSRVFGYENADFIACVLTICDECNIRPASAQGNRIGYDAFRFHGL